MGSFLEFTRQKLADTIFVRVEFLLVTVQSSLDRRPCLLEFFDTVLETIKAVILLFKAGFERGDSLAKRLEFISQCLVVDTFGPGCSEFVLMVSLSAVGVVGKAMQLTLTGRTIEAQAAGDRVRIEYQSGIPTLVLNTGRECGTDWEPVYER